MKKAFSLIELSIVILIIGILVAGVTQSSRLIKQMRLQVARNITTSSPVTSIKDLKIWLETSQEGSLVSSTNGLNPDNNDKISSWNDISPQLITKINPSQSNDALRPLYAETSPINNLPALKFNSNEYLETIASGSNQMPLAIGDDTFTFIAVWNSLSTSTTQAIFEQNTGGSLISGSRASMLIIGGVYGYNGEGNDYQPTNFTMNSSRISVITVDNGAVNIYDNKLNTPTNTGSINNAIQNVSEGGFFIGTKGTNPRSEKFNGFISEIIVFDRVLKKSEIEDINLYLAKKYSIKLL